MRTLGSPIIATLVLTLLLIACGSETNDGVALDSSSTDSASADTGEPLPVCTGLGFDPSAAVFNDECTEFTQCTFLDPPKGQASGCYCAVCGPKGNSIVCIQAQCLTPGT